jgi:hypothetical protein
MRPGKPDDGKVCFEDPSAAAIRALRMHLELDEIEAALGVYQHARRAIGGWSPPPLEWFELIKELIDHQNWIDAIDVMQSYLREVEAATPRVRLKLAQLVLQKRGRPARALRVLAEIPDGSLPPELESVRSQLARQARQLREEGPLELEDEI